MARPREFDIDEALDQAMRVFWSKGYEGTSLSDLVDTVGVKKGSLYKAYGDKRAFYLRVLERYDATEVEQTVQALQSAPDALSGIGKLLDGAIVPFEARGDRMGCLLCNASIDQAPFDKGVEERVLHSLARIGAAIEHVLARSANWAGSSLEERQSMARQILATYVALRLFGKAGRPASMLRSLAGDMLSLVDRRAPRATERKAS